MAEIQFNMTLDLVEQYVPAENITVVQENYQSVEFLFTIMNRRELVDLTGATNIVVSFIKPDGHIVLQNDGSLVNGNVELVANPQAFTYIGKTYLQVQYKIGTKIFNTRQAFIWVERGNTSCQTLSSTDFSPMLDQAIQAGQMLANIDLQALIDSKVTAENAQADVDALELRVGALEVTIVGLDSRVDALELTVVDHETRIDTLEANYPNLSPIEADITALKAKDVEQDGRIGANEMAISAVQTKNTQQDTAIAGNATEIANLQAKDVTHETRMTSIEAKNVEQDDRLSAIETKNTEQDAAITALQGSQATQDNKIAAIETKNTQQDTAISANATSITTVDNKVTANKTAQDTINTSTAGSIANHTTRIETLEADSTTDNARITNLEMDNSSNKTRISATEGAIGVLNSDINALQGSDAIQDADIAAIKTKNTQQDTAISDNSAAIASNKADADAKITGLTTRVGTAETDITGLKTKDTQQDTRMSAIENKDTAQDTRMTTIEEVNTAQNTRLTDIESKNTTQDTDIAGKVSKSGDTMTGNLTLDGARDLSFTNANSDTVLRNNSGGIFAFYDKKNNNVVWSYNPATKEFKLDNAVSNLVKKTGDTMTGDLAIDRPNATTHRNIRFDTNGVADISIGQNTSGKFLAWDQVGGNGIWEYDKAGKSFNILAPNTNLVKKTGDTMTGPTRHRYDAPSIYEYGDSRKAFQIIHPDDNKLVIVAETAPKSGVWDWANQLRITDKGTIESAKDGRADLTLTADAINFDTGAPPIADRRGNTVTVRLAVAKKEGATGNVITSLPSDMRPLTPLLQHTVASDGTVARFGIATNGDITLNVSGKNAYVIFTYVVN